MYSVTDESGIPCALSAVFRAEASIFASSERSSISESVYFPAFGLPQLTLNTIFFTCPAVYVPSVGTHPLGEFSFLFASSTVIEPSELTDLTIPICPVLPAKVSTGKANTPPATGQDDCHTFWIAFSFES
jgi:hypothetical protein